MTKPPPRTRTWGDCACEPALCDGCAAEAVTRVGDRLTCPTACPAPLNREYVERLGVRPRVAQQRLVALHRDRLRRVPEWALAHEGLAGRHEPPPPARPDQIPSIRPGQDRTTLRLLLSGLAAWPNHNGDGVHRECYICAQPVQKGDACLHMACGGAEPHHWDFERGDYNGMVRYAKTGLAAQNYIPLARGPLAAAGFYDGLPGGVLSGLTQRRVNKRRAAWLALMGGSVTPQEERETLLHGALPAGGGFEEAAAV